MIKKKSLHNVYGRKSEMGNDIISGEIIIEGNTKYIKHNKFLRKNIVPIFV